MTRNSRVARSIVDELLSAYSRYVLSRDPIKTLSTGSRGVARQWRLNHRLDFPGMKRKYFRSRIECVSCNSMLRSSICISAAAGAIPLARRYAHALARAVEDGGGGEREKRRKGSKRVVEIDCPCLSRLLPVLRRGG